MAFFEFVFIAILIVQVHARPPMRIVTHPTFNPSPVSRFPFQNFQNWRNAKGDLFPTWRSETEASFCERIKVSNDTISDENIEASSEVDDALRIIMVVDETGSMWSMTDATIESYNGFISSQLNYDNQAEKQKPQLSLIKFDSKFSVQSWDNIDNSYLLDKTGENGFVKYQPGGPTALYDTLGCVLKAYGHERDTILVIITDGEDTSSSRFNAADVKSKITELVKSKDDGGKNWVVNYIGANQDPLLVSESLGISVSNAASYGFTSSGISNMYSELSAKLTDQRLTQYEIRDEAESSGQGFDHKVRRKRADDDVRRLITGSRRLRKHREISFEIYMERIALINKEIELILKKLEENNKRLKHAFAIYQ